VSTSQTKAARHRAAAQRGQLWVVAAPSGAGKTSLVRALLEQDPSLRFSISYTTRPKRSSEVNGRDYFFVTEAEFLAMVDANAFLEHARVFDHWYGTGREHVGGLLAGGHSVLLEIDWQGARQVKAVFTHAVGIFILPPSIDALAERLHKRGQDPKAVIDRRLLAAGSEIAHAPEFDYVIINEDFSLALDQLTSIVTATRLRYASQAARHHALFVQLGIPA
jgi:guanylate kinase